MILLSRKEVGQDELTVNVSIYPMTERSLQTWPESFFDGEKHELGIILEPEFLHDPVLVKCQRPRRDPQ
jgi:hypothetical protein